MQLDDFQLFPPPAPGDALETIDTPALVMDLGAAARNIFKMQKAADAAGMALRPHAKAHKCPELSLWQIREGAVGICCQKVSEAVPFIQAGVRDVHISNEVVGREKVRAVAVLAGVASISVCVDDVSQIDALSAAAEAVGTRIRVLVDLDVGQGRCGVSDAADALRLARHIMSCPALTMRGVQAYHGGTQHLRGVKERLQEAKAVATRICAIVDVLKAAGVPCDVITGGGSGSAEFDLEQGVYTEIQPGSYVFMDVDYATNAYEGELQFEHSLFIATTVMSTAAGAHVVVDAGLKSMAVDSGLPWVWEDGARSTSMRYVAANDEHGIIAGCEGVGNPSVLPLLGTPMLLVPGHVDPTFNLYETLVGVRSQKESEMSKNIGGLSDAVVETVWSVAARGCSR